MKNKIESLLGQDHESLDQLFTALDVALTKPDGSQALEVIDLFWARLAVHIRAENVHLFPALDNAPASLFTREKGLPTYDEVHSLLLQLRSDHDFFMKELAQIMKLMREIIGNQQDYLKEANKVSQRMRLIKKRLRTHNALEEKRAYLWPALLFDPETAAILTDRIQRELEKLPPRFS